MSSHTTPIRQPRQWKPTHGPRVKIELEPKRIDFSKENSNPETGISLCIPFAFKSVGPKRVFAVFNPTIINPETGEETQTSLGFIERIDTKYRRDGNKTMFIHFAPNRWNKNDMTSEILETMKAGNSIRVKIDEDGHYWKTIISKSKRPVDYVDSDGEDIAEAKTEEAVNAGQAVEMDNTWA